MTASKSECASFLHYCSASSAWSITLYVLRIPAGFVPNRSIRLPRTKSLEYSTLGVKIYHVEWGNLIHLFVVVLSGDFAAELLHIKSCIENRTMSYTEQTDMFHSLTSRI